MPRAASVSFVCMRYAGAQVSPKGIRQRVDEIAERLGPGGDTCVRKIFEKHMGESPLPCEKSMSLIFFFGGCSCNEAESMIY